MIFLNYNTLSEELIQELFQWNDETKAGDVWATNHTKWVPSLKYTSYGTILSRVIPDNYKTKIYTELLDRDVINYYPYSCSALFYMGYQNSCVNWHADYPDFDALSIYLNREWDTNWGGWFAFTQDYNFQEGDIKPMQGQFLVPQYNMSIRSTEMEWHCTTPTSGFAPPRYSIQLFFSKDK